VRAAVTSEDHGFDIVDVADPSPGPDELLICVAACGVCGSDIRPNSMHPPA
jgi:(R,R)-butanediol dehydrogenase/meso-butanediol dehydrogenase/diacetyl reductase